MENLFFKRAWKRNTGRDKHGKVDFWTFRLTAGRYAYRKKVEQALKEHAPLGRTLDAGAGTLLYKDVISECCSDYLSADKFSEHPDIDVICDITDLHFSDESFDTVVCNQVLEHVNDTQKALSEILRVLKPGGLLLAGTPFYFYLHAEPYDFYRFTEWGLQWNLSNAGFRNIEIEAVGGFFSSTSEPINIALSSLTFGSRLTQHLIFPLNFSLIALPAIFLDKILSSKRKFPYAYFMIARKPSTQGKK